MSRIVFGQAVNHLLRQAYLDLAQLNGIAIALLVAPDDTVRRSLEFVIQAEGIVVDSHAYLASAVDSPLLKEADCAVVDEDAVHTLQAALEYLHRLPWPVILLAEQPERHDAISRLVPVHILAKPLAGGILLETLRRLRAGDWL